MDYVEWCDSIADAIANYVEQHNRWINLHQFAADFVSTRLQPIPAIAQNEVILDSVEIMKTCNVSTSSPTIELKRADVACLRNHYDRWMYSQMIRLETLELLMLGSLNRLSQRIGENYVTVHEVDMDALISAVEQETDGLQVDRDHAVELLGYLTSRGLAHNRSTVGRSRYKSSYLGVARTNRARVAANREIDELRTAGEGDSLDYKRIYKIGTDAENWEFVKDVTALANAGGSGPRYLLVGVEDDGQFYRPPSIEAEEEHREQLARITETRLQQIVTSRTTHSPSVHVTARGDHRDGPYVLVEVTRDVGLLPYRIYRKQHERNSPIAHESGEVWIRKGSTKSLATEAEIAALEQQAELFQRLRSAV